MYFIEEAISSPVQTETVRGWVHERARMGQGKGQWLCVWWDEGVQRLASSSHDHVHQLHGMLWLKTWLVAYRSHRQGNGDLSIVHSSCTKRLTLKVKHYCMNYRTTAVSFHADVISGGSSYHSARFYRGNKWAIHLKMDIPGNEVVQYIMFLVLTSDKSL